MTHPELRDLEPGDLRDHLARYRKAVEEATNMRNRSGWPAAILRLRTIENEFAQLLDMLEAVATDAGQSALSVTASAHAFAQASAENAREGLPPPDASGFERALFAYAARTREEIRHQAATVARMVAKDRPTYREEAVGQLIANLIEREIA